MSPRQKMLEHKQPALTQVQSTISSSAIDPVEPMAMESAQALPSMRRKAKRRTDSTVAGRGTIDTPHSASAQSQGLRTQHSESLHPLVVADREKELDAARRAVRNQHKNEKNERSRQAWELRKAGASFPSIAQQCGFKTPSAASASVKRYAARAAKEDKYELKMLQMDRLNHMLLVLWPQVQAGSTSAINSALAIWDRIQRAESLDGPVEMSIHHDGLPDNNVLVIGGDAEAYKKALAQLAGRTDIVQAIETNAYVHGSSTTTNNDIDTTHSSNATDDMKPIDAMMHNDMPNRAPLLGNVDNASSTPTTIDAIKTDVDKVMHNGIGNDESLHAMHDDIHDDVTTTPTPTNPAHTESDTAPTHNVHTDPARRSPRLLADSDGAFPHAAPTAENTGATGENGGGVTVSASVRALVGDEVADVMQRLASGAHLDEEVAGD